jgi:hypothetical protein
MKLKVAIALAGVSAMVPMVSQASPYNCNFQKDGTAVHTCKIDPATPNTSCTFKFNDNLSGVCGASGGSGQDMVLCAIVVQTANISAVTSGIPATSVDAAAKALAQKPGFVAGGVTIAPTGKAILAGMYVEKQGEPTLAGVCTP